MLGCPVFTSNHGCNAGSTRAGGFLPICACCAFQRSTISRVTGRSSSLVSRVITHQVEDLDGASVVHIPNDWLAGTRVEEFLRTGLDPDRPFSLGVLL